MNRRTFLSLGATSLAAIGLVKGNKLFAGNLVPAKQNSFSLKILTDKPELAIKYTSAILPNLTKKNIRINETPLQGSFIGDITLTQNGRLVNYKSANSIAAEQLRSIGKILQLPKNISNPVLISFSTPETNSEPEKVQIFRNNIMVDEFDLKSVNKIHTVSGIKGELSFSLKNGKVKVVDTSCKHKTCMHIGEIHHSGQEIICIPNNIRLYLTGGSYKAPDAILY